MSQVLPFGDAQVTPAADDPTTLAGWLDKLALTHWRDVRMVSIRACAQGLAMETVMCDRHPSVLAMRLPTVARHLIDTESAHEHEHPGEPPLHVPGDLRPASQMEHLRAPDPWSRENCRSCGRSVIWAKTSKEKWMPVDARPDPAGNLILVAKPGEPGEPPMIVYVHDRAANSSGVDPSWLRTSHFATCPDADQHRRGRSR